MWRLLKKWFPTKKSIENSPKLQWLGKHLHDRRLWRWQRTPVARGVGLGLLVTFIPLPLQMPLAALLAFWLRGNVFVAVIITWINNPFTYVPINYFIYKVGGWVMRKEVVMPPPMSKIEWKIGYFATFWHESIAWVSALGKVYLVGLPIVCIGAAVIGYVLVDGVWRVCTLIQKYRKH